MQLLVFSMGQFGESLLHELYVVFCTGQQIERVELEAPSVKE